MGHVTIYKSGGAGTTFIPNLFIDEYLKAANDAQIKLYLYLLRMMNSGFSAELSEIAERLNHTEADILRALKYWAEKGFLSLDYDSGQNITGICIQNCGCKGSFSKEQDYAAPKSQKAEPAVRGFSKPAYSASQLKLFKNSRENTEILFIAETYFNRPLTMQEIASIAFYKNILHFADDTIDSLLQYCIEHGRKNFNYIDAVAVSWAERGIPGTKQPVPSAMNGKEETISVETLLKNGAPLTPGEADCVKRWEEEYCFSRDIIIEACRRTASAADTHPFRYADGMLKRWKAQNVTKLADVFELDRSFRSQKKQAAGSNKFNQFQQNAYDFDSLEKDILANQI